MEEDHVRASIVEAVNLAEVWDEVSELLAPACESSQGQDTIRRSGRH